MSLSFRPRGFAHKEIKNLNLVRVDKKSNRSTEVQIKGVTPDKNDLFIGRTKNYIFMYNDSLKKKTCYPSENVENISFKK